MYLHINRRLLYVRPLQKTLFFLLLVRSYQKSTYKNIHLRRFLEWFHLVLPEGGGPQGHMGRRARASSKATSAEVADFVSPLFFLPRYWRRTLGMQVRYAYHEDYQFCYSFRGRPGPKPSILMLHGFSAHKDMWLSVVKVRF